MRPAPAATTAAAPVHAPGRPRLPHLLAIVNPCASRMATADLAAALRTLRASFAITTALTEARGHARELAREAALEGFDLVAVVGGDGSLSEAADGLAGSPTPLAPLPAGCTNVFARACGTPRRLAAAAAHLGARADAGRLRPRAIDLGTVNGRHFLSTSGVGFSATMTALVDTAPQHKARLGQLHFAAAAAVEIGGRYLRRPPRMRLHADGETAEGVTLVAQNSHALTYFGPREIRVCEAAALDSGALSLTLLRRARVRDVAAVVTRLLVRRPRGEHPQLAAFPRLQTAVVVPTDGAPLPLEADGEFLGEHRRIAYGVAPRALRVVA